MSKKDLIIAAAINNIEKIIDPVFQNINSLATQFNEVRCILIESNSTDNTLNCIKQYRDKLTCSLTCISLNNTPFETRIEKISYARNYYLDIIKEKYSTFDYIYMLDFNETNVEPYNLENIMSCFNTQIEWDMICANQEQLYYDLYALRHDIWMPFNCWKMVGNRPTFMSENEAKNIYVRSRFLHIPSDHPLIKVKSAFGGSAFIKTEAAINSSFSPYDAEGYIDCEWVHFCKSIDNVYINPKFINMKKMSRHALL